MRTIKLAFLSATASALLISAIGMSALTGNDVGSTSSSFITYADAKALPFSDFNDDMPTVFPWGYTIAQNNGSIARNGVVTDDGLQGTFGGITAGWRDAKKDTIAIVEKNSRVIRQFTASTRYVQTIAGTGGQPSASTTAGPRLQVTFNTPVAIVNFRGDYIIADYEYHCLTKMSATAPTFSDVSVFAGTCGPPLTFDRPSALAATLNYVYVADLLNDAVKRVSPNGLTIETVATLTDLRPTIMGIFDDNGGYVISSAGKVYKVNFATSTVSAPLFPTYGVNLNVQGTVDYATRTFFYIATKDNQNIIVGVDGYTDKLTEYYEYGFGIEDGEDPTFRDISSLIALSDYELLVLGTNSIRGVYIRAPHYTNTRTITHSISEYNWMDLPVYFLASIMPMHNATAMEVLRNLFVLDLNECLMGVSRVANATDFEFVTPAHNPSAPPVVVVTNASVPKNFPPEGHQIVKTCNYWRMRNFLGNDASSRMCAVNEVDVKANAVDDYYCVGHPIDTQRVCDTRCKVAAILSSLAFAACVAIVIALALSANGGSVLVSIFLLMPEGI